jgi:hypothetical protein
MAPRGSRSEPFPARQLPLDEGGEEHRGGRQRVRLHAHEAEQPGHDGLDLVAQVLLGGIEGHARRVERLQHVQRHARPRARRVDDRIVGLLQRRDVAGAEAPLREALLPGGRGVDSGRLHVLAIASRGLGVDPGLERSRVETVEEQQQVREVTLRVDRDHRDALAQQLFEEDDGEAGLARARHADDEPVGQQVGGVELEPWAGLAAFEVDLPSEVEPVAHRASLSVSPQARRRDSGSLAIRWLQNRVYAASHAGGAVSSTEVGARARPAPEALAHEPLPPPGARRLLLQPGVNGSCGGEGGR